MGSSILVTLRRVARKTCRALTLSGPVAGFSGVRRYWVWRGSRRSWSTAQVDTEESFEAGEDQPYQVIDGKVDPGTYNGYRRYQSHYHACHGQDDLGGS